MQALVGYACKADLRLVAEVTLQESSSARVDLEDMRGGHDELQPHYSQAPHVIWPCALHHWPPTPIPVQHC